MQDNIPPCHNCITLAICKAQMYKNYENKAPIFKSLFPKCLSLRNFVLKETKTEDPENKFVPHYTVHVQVENTIAVIKYALGDEIADFYAAKNPPM